MYSSSIRSVKVMRMSVYIFAQLAVVIVFFSLFLVGCQQEVQHRQVVRPVVKTMRVSLEASAEDRTYSGIVVSRHEVQESFRVDGRIAQRLVDVGDIVRKGQVLATLDESDLRLSMESALAELRAAESNWEKARTDEKRFAALLSRSVVSESEFDAMHLAADEAKGRLNRASRALSLAKNRHHYTKLVCSTDGVITKTSAEAGQVVTPGQSIVSVAREGAQEVLVHIPESRIQNLKDSQAEVTLWSNSEKRFRAVLREIAPEADSATRTYAVRYSLIKPDEAVRLGMTAVLHLAGQTHTNLALVPLTALFDQGNGTGVWVVNPETGGLSFRRVAIDHYSEQAAFVSGEVADGDIIVVAGVHKLDPSMHVRLTAGAQETVQ